MALALASHAPVFIGASLGEQDTARFVNDALLWWKADIRQFAFSDYRYFVSPGYIVLVRALLPLSVRSGIEIGYVLNGLNLVACVVAVIPAYRILRVFLDREVTFCSMCVLVFMPTFWQGGLYGFPHMLALLFMLLALALLASDRSAGERPARSAPAMAVIVCLTAAILLKADIYISAIAAPLLQFRDRIPSARAVAQLTAMLLIPIAIAFAVAVTLMQDEPNLAQFTVAWNRQYQPQPTRLLSSTAVGGWLFSFGFVSLPIALAGGLRASFRYRLVPATVILTWLAIPLLFWSSRPFDSARHHFQSSVPVTLGIGLALEALPAGLVRRVATGLIVILNYWAFPPSAGTGHPSGNLLGSAELIKERVGLLHRFGARFAGSSSGCRVVLGTNTNPYVEFEILQRAERLLEARRGKRMGFDTLEYVIETGSGHTVASTVVVPEVAALRLAGAYEAAGYEVVSFEYRIDRGADQISPCERLPWDSSQTASKAH